MDNKWISKWGFILPNSNQSQSENGVLFSVEYALLLDEKIGKQDIDDEEFSELIDFNDNLALSISDLWSTNGGSYRTLPHDDNPRFSLDNMKAVAAFSRRYITASTQNEENLEKLSLFRKYSLRPDSFFFLLYCKYPAIGFWFLWIVSLSMIFSCSRKEEYSSGKNLAFVQYKGANMKLTWWLCSKLIKNNRQPWAKYFPEPDHPINVEARKIWSDNE